MASTEAFFRSTSVRGRRRVAIALSLFVQMSLTGALSKMTTVGFLAPGLPARLLPLSSTNISRAKGTTRLMAPSVSMVNSPAQPTVATTAARARPVPYACPRCQTPANPLSEHECGSCGFTFNVRDGFYDLVVPEAPRSIFQPPRQRVFQNPLVSFAYERGWRDQFAAAGFPGVDAEYAMLEKFLLGEGASLEDEEAPIVDLSCGSGLMARRMSASGRFSRVVAVDLSAAMLREALLRGEKTSVSFDAVRADITKLPFEPNSLQFVHAGAALHCWARLQDALAEIHRVMAPGAKFFATTFLRGAYLPQELVDANIDPRIKKAISSLAGEFQSQSQTYRFFDKDELIWLLRAAGFADASVEVQRRCAIIRCTKGQ